MWTVTANFVTSVAPSLRLFSRCQPQPQPTSTDIHTTHRYQHHPCRLRSFEVSPPFSYSRTFACAEDSNQQRDNDDGTNITTDTIGPSEHTHRLVKTRSHPLWQMYHEDDNSSSPSSSSSTSPPPPSLTLQPHHWINLTNGVELLPDISTLLQSASSCVTPDSIRFTRLQSSHCESSAYDKLLWSVDNDMLLSLSVGRTCYVYDLASRNKLRGVSRALFLGLQFVRWSLAYLWWGADRPHLVPDRVLVRGKNVVPFWRDVVMHHQVAKDTKKRIRYFAGYAKEMQVAEVNLYGVYGKSTQLDGCIDLHVKFVRQWIEQQQLHDHDEITSSDSREDDYQVFLENAGLVVHDPELTCEELRHIQRQLNDRNGVER